ncbi:gdp-l-fucose synthetase [Stylonychia lemnae]|uniref:GDP-L-fucose synthase n=1 Tax=Stylonychia lemnae TaxID=5949 RepID=A0A078BEL6_STYLE|nr:gdp-l-fucose synthetase [Stylonychia lemnae]|eukprot:CDW91597.1 gdp-l-fucose synthetase [Stylonychia lemnae]
MEEQQKIKILVTGGTGLVGSNLRELVEYYQSSQVDIAVEDATNKLEQEQDNQSLDNFIRANVQNHEFIYLSSKDCNLLDGEHVKELFRKHRPTYVINLAARVGGLFANMNNKVQFYEENIQMQMNIIKACHEFGIKRLICTLSTCIYPDKIEYPIAEEDLHKGPPHPSNEGYAYAKRQCQIQCQIYNEQFGTDFLCVVPTNIYGKYDQYNESSSHVVPALIRKAAKAKEANSEFLVLGSGSPLRQFCYAPDLGKLLLWVLYRKESLPLISLVPEEEYTIKELAENIAQISGIENIVFDTTKADGQYKKTMSNKLLQSKLKYFKFTDLKEGLKMTIENFKNETRL